MGAIFRACLFLLFGISIGVLLVQDQNVQAQLNPGEEDNEPLPLEELRAFTETFAIIKSNYVEPVDDKKLLENAIRGMLAGLDPHSSYLDGAEYKDLREGTSGEFGGLGIEVTMEDGFVKVVSPIDDTPAYQAGLLPGDLIIRLDDTPVKGLSLADAVKMMRGPPGEKIVLTVIREGESKPLKIEVVRAVIKVNSVKARKLEPGFGYIRISQFQVDTGKKLLELVNKLEEEQKGLKGLILDLRNNPGGVLEAAVSVSDIFIDDGLIVYTEGRDKDLEKKYTATPGDALNQAPLVVLVNGGSASASEIVAGALQDHQRAVLMGSATFGKGSVQTILPMKGDTALKLTTARYFTPKGRSIQAEGIVPDVLLRSVRLTAVEDEFKNLQERDLSGHLENAKPNQETQPPSTDKSKSDKKDPDSENIVDQDYAVYEALNLLKALSIVANKK